MLEDVSKACLAVALVWARNNWCVTDFQLVLPVQSEWVVTLRQKDKWKGQDWNSLPWARALCRRRPQKAQSICISDPSSTQWYQCGHIYTTYVHWLRASSTLQYMLYLSSAEDHLLPGYVRYNTCIFVLRYGNTKLARCAGSKWSSAMQHTYLLETMTNVEPKLWEGEQSFGKVAKLEQDRSGRIRSSGSR